MTMKKTQTSTTALGIAAMRALESEKPTGQRICYDPFARQLTTAGIYFLSKLFAGYGERRAPGAQGFIVCRCRYFDDYLQRCLTSGAKQVVILGAGLDSRAYRGEILQRAIRTFEVDHPATQASKIKRLNRVLGQIPAHVTHVPIDFNHETLDKLLACGFDRSLKTLFIWEGVTYYLQPEAVDATLAWVRANALPGSTIIFDYMFQSALTAAHQRGEVKRMQRYRHLTGEGLVFGLEQGHIETFLTDRGFTHVVNAIAEDLERLYCAGTNQGRTVAGIYAIVYAQVADGGSPGSAAA
jgi:methyltransferase (TIGR00027 family)